VVEADPRVKTRGVVVRVDDTTMPRLAAHLALLSTAGAMLSTASAMRPSSFWQRKAADWQLKAADLTVGAVVIPTLARRWDDRAAFRAARKRLS
jgi:hypothetical protein